MRGAEWLEAIIGGVVCAAIVIAVVVFVAMMQPIQNVASTEAVELRLIKAIYVDEFARKFVKYGMIFILEDAASKAAQVGGINFGNCGATGKCWVNYTDPDDIILAKSAKDTDSFLPYTSSQNAEERQIYFYWCTNTTNSYYYYADCKPRSISDVLTTDEHKELIANSFEGAFSLSSYLSKFGRYADIQPEITFENYQIEIDPKVQMTGDVHVIVRAGESGVDSREIIDAQTEYTLWDIVSAGRDFADNNLIDTVDGIDYCQPDYWDINFTEDFNAALSSVGDYDLETDTVDFSLDCTSPDGECLIAVLSHTLNKTVDHTDMRLGFRTEFRHCK